MRVVAAVLTFNPSLHGRLGLLDECMMSLKEADRVMLVDNGSVDPVPQADHVNGTGLTTSGMGTNLCARVCLGADADICVLSDDDMFWRPGWRGRLEAWWAEAPQDIALTGCHLEADYPWNQRSGVVEAGGMKGLIRASTGAASWTFRAPMWQVIGPVPQQVQGWGDVPTCDKLTGLGYRIAQIDLAEHRGVESTWGNRTDQKYGSDLSVVRSLLEAS